MHYPVAMSDDRRFRPCEITELANPVSLLNEPLSPDIAPRRQLPLSALIAANLANTEALLARLEGGVRCRSDEGRDGIRELYLSAKHFARALQRCLDLEVK
jgi:hypothetical protein